MHQTKQHTTLKLQRCNVSNAFLSILCALLLSCFSTDPLEPEPSVPVITTAEAVSYSSVFVKWNYDANLGSATFHIYYRTDLDTAFQLAGSTDTCAYILSWLEHDTKYYLKVEVSLFKTGGGYTHAESESVTVSTPKAALPGIPERLVAEATSYRTVELSIDTCKGAQSYTIYRSKNPDGPYDTTTITPYSWDVRKGTFTYTDRNLEQSTVYYYRVKANNPAGSSAFSTSVGCTTSVFSCACGTSEIELIKGCDSIDGCQCRPSWGIIEALGVLLQGDSSIPVADAPSYNQKAKGIHPLVYLLEDGQFCEGTFCLPQEWNPDSIGSVELVAYYGEEHAVLAATALYIKSGTNDTLFLRIYQYQRSLILLEAATGDTVMENTRKGELPTVPETRSFDKKWESEYGEALDSDSDQFLEFEEIIDILRHYVEVD